MSLHDVNGVALAGMIRNLLQPNGINDARVLSAIQTVPRHLFVPAAHRPYSYDNLALPLAVGQSMLSPLLIATMLQALALKGTEQILEIGTGSGYVTALLVMLGASVFSLERSPILADRAGTLLYRLGYQVDLHLGDGSQGLPDMSPFDAIIVNGAVPRVHRALVNQLDHQQGRMVIAVGEHMPFRLRRIRRDETRYYAQTLQRVDMPHLIGRYGFPPPDQVAGV